uniref:Uncharacterized protein n=1 Tax=Ditylenchus dipsaci TaxID=166011 RepID=A0A915DH02_9BILA
MVFVDGYIDETEEYYLERNSKIAEYVIEYSSQEATQPHDICLERFREELAFWHLINVELAPCCSILADASKIEESLETERELDEVSCMPEFRKVIWHLMKVMLGLILGSMPEFQEDSRFAEFYHLNLQRKGQRGNLGPITFDNNEGGSELNAKGNNINYFEKYQNMTDGSAMVMLSNNSAIQFFYKPTDNPHHYLIQLEYLCIAWFTLEFLLRLLKLKEIIGAMLVIRILRVLRMARVFKLARYSTGLQVFGNTLQSSLRELCMLSMFLVTGTIFFSTIMFFLEKDEPGTDFRSIPAACWWCIITVTTVGYGDCLIQTSAGKTVAAIASIFGIIILAFPISMVVENFAFAQQQSQVENQMREAQMAAVANDY